MLIILRYDYEDRKQLISSSTLQLLAKSTLLDPRFKDGNIAIDLLDTIKDQLIEEGRSLQLENLKPQSDMATVDSASTSKTTSSTLALAPKTLADLLRKKEDVATPSQPRTPAEEVRHQLQRYMEVPTRPVDSDPLQWWETVKQEYSALSGLAKKYLSLCATSVTSERLFSVAGNIVTSRRQRLKPANVNRMVFLACNMSKDIPCESDSDA